MNRNHITMLFDYNYWANARVLKAATRVTRDQFTAPARLSHGSLRGTLAHVLATKIVWRLRCQEGVSVLALPAESRFPTLDALRASWAEEERKMRGYFASLTDEGLAQCCSTRRPKAFRSRTSCGTCWFTSSIMGHSSGGKRRSC